MSFLQSGVFIDSAPFQLSLLCNMPAVILLSLYVILLWMPVHYLQITSYYAPSIVIGEIPTGSHLTHIPDLHAESHKDNHQE